MRCSPASSSAAMREAPQVSVQDTILPVLFNRGLLFLGNANYFHNTVTTSKFYLSFICGKNCVNCLIFLNWWWITVNTPPPLPPPFGGSGVLFFDGSKLLTVGSKLPTVGSILTKRRTGNTMITLKTGNVQ